MRLLPLGSVLAPAAQLALHALPAARAVAQIIQVNLTSESPQPIVSGSALTFTYSVQAGRTVH